jgi:hypothetical protein
MCGGTTVSGIDELWKRKEFLRAACKANRVFSNMIIVSGLVISYFRGWEVLVGSALVYVVLTAAGVILSGRLQLAEWDYSEALYEEEDET